MMPSEARSPESAPSSLLPAAGQVLSERWELISRLGAGGMGEVWRARHVQLGRQVAVKMLLSPSLSNRARLSREAKVLASLRHPSIVEVFDVGEHQGAPYFVMEWLDGETLSERIEREGALTPERAIPLFLPLLEGLSRVHRAGVVHRDLKPDNVLVTRRGGEEQLVLIDFGIALTEGPAAARITHTGGLVGTPEYMAPEVLRGHGADVRADVWGIGVTLFEALTGASPFRREDFVSTVCAVVDETPVAWPPQMEGSLRAKLERAIDKSDQRYASVEQLRSALESWWVARRKRSLALTEPRGARRPTLASAPVAPAHETGERAVGAWADAGEAPAVSLDALIRSRFGAGGS